MCRARVQCLVAKPKNPNKDVVNFECVSYGMENVVASVAISSNSADTKHVANKIVIFISGTNAKDDDRLHVMAERSASGLALLPSGHYAQYVCKRVYRTAQPSPSSTLGMPSTRNGMRAAEWKLSTLSFRCVSAVTYREFIGKFVVAFRDVRYRLLRDCRWICFFFFFSNNGHGPISNCQLHFKSSWTN